MVKAKLQFSSEFVSELFGPQDLHLVLLAERTGARIETRGNVATLHGEQDQIDLAAAVLRQLDAMLRKGAVLFPQDVECAYRVLAREPNADVQKIFSTTVFQASKGKKAVTPKTLGQRNYVEAIQQHDLTFGLGPAGTGKTYLAVAMAATALATKQVKRIILTRPAVEAGEKLGFLPGDLVEKVNPYLRPLYDALGDMLDFRKVQEYQETGVLEVAPLAFMRGRTLSDAFVILDEAQNTSPQQMQMFLTRLGFGSKAVVTGDMTQVDLPKGQASGLVHCVNILKDIKEIACIRFTDEDVIRHPLVARIVQAYEVHGEKS